MANDNLTADQVRAMATEIGMTNLSDEHLQQLLRATQSAQARRAALRVDDLTYADEPAHLPRLTAGDEK